MNFIKRIMVRWGLIKNLTRPEILEIFGYEEMGFCEGGEKITYARKDQKYFHVKENGLPLYKEKYEEVSPSFKEGLGWAKKKSKYFHITEDGKPLYHQRYEGTDYFENGRALVEKEGRWVYINKNGWPVESLL